MTKKNERAALIKKVEKSGVILRTDWSALYQKKKGPGANVTASERKLANTFPGSSVGSSDMFGANITAAERKLRKKKAPVYKRIKKRGPR